MSQQDSWLYCENCGGLFFAGNNKMGACPAGGAHNPRHSGAYALSNAPPGQPGWSWCANCQGLFFSGNDLGVCPTHKPGGIISFDYVLPQSQSQSASDVYEPGWSLCNKCQGLFYSADQPNTAFNCPAGGFHESLGSGLYFLPQQSADGQPDWKRCSKCFGLFWSLTSKGGCPCGDAHDGSSSGLYFLPASGALNSLPPSGIDGQAGWKYCTQCQGLFYGGNNLGVCPVPQGHILTPGTENYVLLQTGSAQAGSTEQPGWNWCNKCQGLFYPGQGVWCPSRAWGQPGNRQPGLHNPWNTPGSYVLPRLGGNYNYAMYNGDGTPLPFVSVTIDITHDIVFEFGNTGTTGCGFQLNAYSPSGSNIGWQQYSIILNGNQLIWSIDNWPISGGNLGPNIINPHDPAAQLLALVPAAGRIPAGYKLIISLSSINSSANIAEATYAVYDSGEQLVQTTVLLQQFNLVGTSTQVTQANLAPIVAFEVVFVGPFNSEDVLLSSGAGTITYSAVSSDGQPVSLTASLQLPSNVGFNVQGTGENSNSIYEVLPPNPGTSFSQGFSIFPVEL